MTESLLENVSHLYMSGYTLLNENTRTWALDLMQTARDRHVSVVLDPASSGPLSGVPAIELERWLRAADALVPNEQEEAVLVSKIPREQWPLSNVVTKCGGNGARVEVAGARVALAAPHLEIVDTIGAGDAFAAGMLAGLANGSSIEDAAKTAIKVASAAVVIRGAQPTLSSTLELS